MLSVKRFHLTDKEKNSTGLVVFNTNIPMPPHPKDKYNPTREEGSINAQAETRSVLQSLIALLAPYQPTRIMDAERGEIVEVLAKPYGMGEVVGGATHPFKIVTRTGTGNNPPTYGGVVNSSLLFTGLGPDSTYNTTGLLGVSQDEDDPNWFTLSNGMLIYLEMEFNGSGVLVDAAVMHGTSSNFNTGANPWTSKAYVEDDGATAPTPKKHKYSRKLIGKAVVVDGDYVIDQRMREHQVITNICVNGRPAKYPRPY
jgi:hypothetical protein